MRKIAATYVFPIAAPPIKYGILILGNNGEVVDVIDTKGELKETENLEYYNGILVPGFVNAHCHIELSYLKGILSGGQGLTGFIDQLISKRTTLPHNLEEIIASADAEMLGEGIVAVGDITNNDYSIPVKERSKLYYHSFVEVFDRDPERANAVFDEGIQLFNEYKQHGLDCSMTPHASYSMSEPLLKCIQQHNPVLYSIHNQETASENEMFLQKTGKMVDLLSKFGTAMNQFSPSGKSSLQSVMAYFPDHANKLLIHNIFTSQADVEAICSIYKNLFWVLCPSSNLIIENQLPDINMLINNNLQLAIGTDSYSSNTRLSMLHEIAYIQSHFPSIELNTLFNWATLGGANALGISNKYGSFEKGKQPGVNLITGVDFETMSLSNEARVKVLV